MTQEINQGDLEFARQHNLSKTEDAIQSGKDYSFIIKTAVQECGSTDRLLALIFRAKNASFAYYLFKHADLTHPQKKEIIIFFKNENETFRFVSLIKEDLVSGGIIDIIIDHVIGENDYDSLYAIGLYANTAKIDEGQKRVIVNAAKEDTDTERRINFAKHAKWLRKDQKEVIQNG